MIRVVHRTAARTRLRGRGMRGNAQYFEQLRSALAQMAGVRAVRVNPRTESVLLEHDVPIDPLLREAEQRGFLQLDLEPVPGEPYLARVGRALNETDQKMEEASSGRVNLETLAFVGMLTGGIVQVFRGNGLPAGVTLLRYAVEFVAGAAQKELMAQARRSGDAANGSGK
jgi:hypothetical protein